MSKANRRLVILVSILAVYLCAFLPGPAGAQVGFSKTGGHSSDLDTSLRVSTDGPGGFTFKKVGGAV
ncbi:MAG TPA: hypothetical protein VFV34_07360, partial [Blastocatellia bacterium]|nr:hypothetical protein [Blastocatellia bacterium]